MRGARTVILGQCADRAAEALAAPLDAVGNPDLASRISPGYV
jgi:hypothetical protein